MHTCMYLWYQFLKQCTFDFMLIYYSYQFYLTYVCTYDYDVKLKGIRPIFKDSFTDDPVSINMYEYSNKLKHAHHRKQRNLCGIKSTYVCMLFLFTVPSCYITTNCRGRPINRSISFSDCCTNFGASFNFNGRCQPCPNTSKFLCNLYNSMWSIT